MPRANRHFLPGHIWHITHRCHQKKFLLKFARDRHRYLHWIFEAKKRFGLSVLNYMITSNHVHLLIKDTGPNVIADSMQLIAGRTAQEYNQRKDRHGAAFWEDRYQPTAALLDLVSRPVPQYMSHLGEAVMTVTDRIEVNPRVMLGKPVIRGTRIPVELILRKLSEGATEDDLLDAYPRLSGQDIQAAIGYAADTLAHEETLLVTPRKKIRTHR